MGTGPIKAVFGPATPPSDSSAGPEAGRRHLGLAAPVEESVDQSASVDSAREEIASVADAVAALQHRLEHANEHLRQVNAVRATELEIGRLFVEAQRFAEAYLIRLEDQVQEILAKAEAKAAQILREATQEAQELRQGAGQTAHMPALTVQKVQAAIAGMAGTHSDLMTELYTLNAMLAPLRTRRSDDGNEAPGQSESA